MPSNEQKGLDNVRSGDGRLDSVGLEEGTSYRHGHDYESKFEAVIKLLELPAGSQDYLEVDYKTKHLLKSYYEDMQAQLKDLQAEIQKLERGLQTQKGAALVWKSQYSTVKKDRDNKEDALREIDEKAVSMKTELNHVKDKLEHRNDGSQRYRQEDHASQLVSLEKGAATIEADHQSKEHLTDQLKAHQPLANAVEEKRVEIGQPHDRSHTKYHCEAGDTDPSKLHQDMQCMIAEFQASKDDHDNQEKPIPVLKAENGTKIHKLEQKIQDITAELQVSNEARDTFEKKYLSIEETHANYASRISAWHEEKKKLNKQLVGNRKSLSVARKENKELKISHEEDHSEYVRREEEWNTYKIKLLKDLQDSKGLSQQYNFILSDGEILGRWAGLKNKIQQFVDNYNRLPPDETLSQPSAAWQGLSSKISGILKEPMLYPCALEAYIWHWLVRIVFAPCSTAWAGLVGTQFSRLTIAVQASARARDLAQGHGDILMGQYHQWRSFSNNLLSRLSEPDNKPESFHVQMTKFIGELTDSSAIHEVDKESVLASLSTIFTDARAFDIGRRKLRANVKINLGLAKDDDKIITNGFALDANTMKNITPPCVGSQPTSQNPVVTLCVSPGLIREGDCEGSDYDKQEVLDRMYVLCDRTGPPYDNLSQANAEQKKAQETTLGHETEKKNVSPPQKNQTTNSKKNTQAVNKAKNRAFSKQEKPKTVIKPKEKEPLADIIILENRKSLSKVKANPPTSTKIEGRDGDSIRRRRSTRPAAETAKRILEEMSGEESADGLSEFEQKVSDTNPRKKRKSNPPPDGEWGQDSKLKSSKH